MASDSGCGITLPEELVFWILVWLLVASVLRFKSACNAWLNHIDNSRFISQHTRHLDSNSEDNKLILLNWHVHRYFFFNINFVSVSELQLYKYIEFSPTGYLHQWLQFSCEKLFTSFHGVIYLCYESHDFVDEDVIDRDVVCPWNPATSQFTILPLVQSDINKGSKYGPRVSVEYGVGFDVENNDYKAVRVMSEYVRFVSEYDDLFNMEPYKTQVEVYNLITGSWRIIDAALPLYFDITENPRQPFQNEIFCWLGFDWSLCRSLILPFDFSKEVFGFMPLPDVRGKWILTYLGGKIACPNWLQYEPQTQCKIWVLDEYGVEESGTNLYTIKSKKMTFRVFDG